MSTTSCSSSSVKTRDDVVAEICETHRQHLLPNLSRFRKPKEPVRPARWKDMSDYDIMGQIRDARHSAKHRATKQDIEVLMWLGIWRLGVMRYEQRCEGNILCLLRAAASFHELGDGDTAYRLLAFCCEEYGFHLGSADTTEIQRREMATRYATRRDLMPDMFLLEGYRGVRRRTTDATQVAMTEVW